MQVYYSALIFRPQASIIRRLFKAKIPQWLKTPTMLNEHWSPCLQLFEGHTHSILSVAFSPDSRLLVSASADCSVRIWETATGATLRTLRGHTGPVRSVAVSPDSRLIASASRDCTVRLWDLQSGHQRAGFGAHGDVTSVAFSSDSRQVIFVSCHQVVQVRDAWTGSAIQSYFCGVRQMCAWTYHLMVAG